MPYLRQNGTPVASHELVFYKKVVYCGSKPSGQPMNSDTKYKIVERIVNTNDETLLKEIYALLDMSETDFWHDLSPSVQASIEQGLEDVRQGKTRSHQEVISEIKARFAR